MNLVLLARGEDAPEGAGKAVAAGALVPDLPMFFFYAIEKLVRGLPDEVIWSTRYFEPGPQAVFDAFNSIPLALVGLAVSARAGWVRTKLFFASVIAHCLFDLPVHHDDGHRHFVPLSSFRFDSPLSYWDPDHYGTWVALGEGLLVILATRLLWDRAGRGARVALGVLCVAMIGGWFGFYCRRLLG